MRKTLFFLFVLITAVSLLVTGCGSSVSTVTVTETKTVTTTQTVTTTISSPAITQTVTSTLTSPAATVTVTKTVTAPTTPPATTPPPPTTTSVPGTDVVTLNDPAGDVHDSAGLLVTGEPQVDITGVEFFTDGDYYAVNIKLAGDIPSVNSNPQTYYEWDVYIDADKNVNTGDGWTAIHPGLGAEYRVRLDFQGNTRNADITNFIKDETEAVFSSVNGNIIQLRWPKDFYASSDFNFMVVSLRFRDKSSQDLLNLWDRVPNAGLAQFPKQ